MEAIPNPHITKDVAVVVVVALVFPTAPSYTNLQMRHFQNLKRPWRHDDESGHKHTCIGWVNMDMGSI